MIRVFSVPNGDKVAQFRRGTYGARIFSIAFNPVSSLLAVSSDTETVHIYKLGLGEAKRKPSGGASSRAEQARRAAQQSYENDEDDESQTGSIGRYNSEAGRGGYDAYIDSKRNQGMG